MLKYPYLINKESPLVLHIHKPKEGTLMRAEKGFVYVVDPEGFKEEPAGSWQFVTKSEPRIHAVVETKGDDFTYPVKIFTDSDPKE